MIHDLRGGWANYDTTNISFCVVFLLWASVPPLPPSCSVCAHTRTLPSFVHFFFSFIILSMQLPSMPLLEAYYINTSSVSLFHFPHHPCFSFSRVPPFVVYFLRVLSALPQRDTRVTLLFPEHFRLFHHFFLGYHPANRLAQRLFKDNEEATILYNSALDRTTNIRHRLYLSKNSKSDSNVAGCGIYSAVLKYTFPPITRKNRILVVTPDWPAKHRGPAGESIIP